MEAGSKGTRRPSLAWKYSRWMIHKVRCHELSSTEAAGNVGYLDFSMGGQFPPVLS